MNLRTDHELYDAIMQGGREVSRSRLMPSFKDSIDDWQAWNLVAYIRTLHPRIEDIWPQASERQYHEVILSQDRIRALERNLGRSLPVSARPVYFHTLLDSLGGVSAYVLFPYVEHSGLRMALAVAIGADRQVARVRTHDRIELRGVDVDAYLAGRREPSSVPLLEALRKEIELTALRLTEALEQQKEDLRTEKELLEAFDLRPQTLPRAQRLFLEDCMACHGPLGRPTAFQREYKPRNLADPEHMGRLDDTYLQAVIKHGGIPFNISPSMPSHARLAPDDLKALAEYVRSLSR
jgi:mono/diheme cytochrome c family protein